MGTKPRFINWAANILFYSLVWKLFDVYLSMITPSKLPYESAVARITEHVRKRFTGEGTGHDWWHIERVRRLALRIGEEEGADLLIVELGALLHDVADYKLHGGDVQKGMALVREWLGEGDFPENVKTDVIQIVENVSYKGADVPEAPLSLEGMVVRDADRLDAMGAVGIARTFAYGGNRNRPIYDPEISPEMHNNFESYKSSNAPTINHFYEKLLLLKDRMHTTSAKTMAEARHNYMQTFLDRFLCEWEGEC